MSILRLAEVTREVGTFVILDHITAAVAVGERIGLVGPNGAGKTTLLRIAAGLDEPDGGSVHRKRGLSLGVLAQEAHFDAAFMAAPDIRTAVRTGAAHLDSMAAELADLEREHLVTEPRYADLQHRFETLGGYTLDQRVDATLSGLGFARHEWSKPPASLSGGEQTRAALARLVVADPELLLLDEPTNHLDLDALEWLEEHLRRRTGALLVASHDRAFLDAAVERIWELRDRKLTVFRGDYSAYHRQREERDARQAKDVESQADQIAREQELVQNYRSHRKFAKMHEHEARLERLQADRVENPKSSRKLRLPTAALAGGGPVRSGEIVVRIEELVAGYLPDRGGGDDGTASVATGSDGGPKPVVRVPFLAAQRGERIGIVGPNGAGKTTLLRTIAGDLPPLDGVLVFGHNVSLGYLAQLRGAAFPGATVLDALLDAIPITAGEARGYLARFLFRGDDALKEVRALSGGERSRLELALLGIMPSNLLLLDEPTNHLDIPAREAIESFLADTPATLLVVSHDRRLLETVCERLWVVEGALAAPFDSGYRSWRAAVASGWTVAAAIDQEARRLRGGGTAGAVGRTPRAQDVEAERARSRATTATAAPPARRPRAGARREKLSKDAYRRQKAAVESELTRLGLRKNHLELAMADPSVQANFVELRRIGSELADIETSLAAAEDAWLEVEERAP
ncbi:MAG TPA: ABC-F family ATP-binding cassette domain-containing protein [Candidatus Limnocylindrales bacterium]|nr:ABC-F family ATP-binding cassette domain-containing protein [Candidatus Limnocylindrales bacterium]